MTGALHVLQLQLSSPPPSSLAPIKSRMETFWYRIGPPQKMAVKTERGVDKPHFAPANPSGPPLAGRSWMSSRRIQVFLRWILRRSDSADAAAGAVTLMWMLILTSVLSSPVHSRVTLNPAQSKRYLYYL